MLDSENKHKSSDCPVGTLVSGKEFNVYYEWRENNKYRGKKFSIMGDSISTLNGYNPSGYKVFYYGDNCIRANIEDYKGTWWGEVLEFFDAKLLVNNSWSGSRVTKLPDEAALFPSGCSDERTSFLHINKEKPDVIIIYIGTNDWAFGAKPVEDPGITAGIDNEVFEIAYETMLRKIKNNYLESEIWCCTLSRTFISSNPRWVFPDKYAGNYIEQYNDIIRRTVIRQNCMLIDLYKKEPYDSIDGTHPNRRGMKTIAAGVCYEMADSTGKSLLTLGTEKQYREKEYLIGMLVGKECQLKKIIGSGGTAEVYLATDVSGTKYFVKSFRKDEETSYMSVMDLVYGEVRLLSKMHHPYIRRFIGQAEDETHFFLILEYVEGIDLERLADRTGGVLPVEKVVKYAIQIAEALQYIHSLTPPIIYRDVKPGNILIDPDDNVKFIDFAIAIEYNQYTKAKCQLGTKGYAPPEQYVGDITPRTDIYALGVTMHELLTGVNPISPQYEPFPIRHINPSLPKGLEYIISKCTEREPDKRYQNCNELICDLKNYQNLPKSRGIFKIFRKK